MELNTETKQQLEKLLAKPTLVAQEHIPLLQELIKAYPYYQPLYLLLAKAGIGTEYQHLYFANAAIHNNGNILHQVIHEPQKLTPIEEVNVISYQPWTISQNIVLEETVTASGKLPKISTESTSISHTETEHSTENLEPLKEEANEGSDTVPTSTEENEIVEITAETKKQPTLEHLSAPEIENLEPLENETIGWQKETIANVPKLVETMEEDKHQTKPTPFIAPEIENLEPLQSEIIKVCEAENIQDEHTGKNIEKATEESSIAESEKDEQETFEEIGELIIPENHISSHEEKADIATEKEKYEIIDEIATEEDKPITIDETANDNLAIGNIASADFFAFEKNFSAETISEEDKQQEVESLEASTYQKTGNIVSKYDDDKLPFTFLWWLAKTRKDHEQIFRPYVSPVKPTLPTADLHQQYVEHIFHLQSPFDPNTEPAQIASEQKVLSKENELIENFIKNEPQIKVPKPDQINNENKAKKSAEDNYDLVSETLAEIYIEQMLYHKAIDTYQKLSLKFPEKSRYFADLIQSLEKKI